MVVERVKNRPFMKFSGSKCTTSKGNSGVCRYIEDCTEEKKTLTEEGEYPAVLCSQSGQETVYCCENGGTVSPTATATGPSKQQPKKEKTRRGIVSKKSK